MAHITKSKLARGGGSHNINLLTPTGRRAVDIRLVKIVYQCIHCLGKLKTHNAGVVCELNSNHYGYIHRDEAANLTQEERFMKISKMFPSDYFRGLDIDKPFTVTIKSVTAEKARDQDGKMVDEFVMRFEEIDKKLRLNLTMAKATALALGDNEADTDNWIGKRVTIYQDKAKAFGKEHIVPRIREVRRDDVDLAKAIKSAQPAKPKPAAPNGSNSAKLEQSAEAAPKTKAPTTGEELLKLVNDHVLVPYNDPYHLRNAIRLELHNNKWDFPAPDDRDGWEEGYKLAKKHAQGKTNEKEPEPVLAEDKPF